LTSYDTRPCNRDAFRFRHLSKSGSKEKFRISYKEDFVRSTLLIVLGLIVVFGGMASAGTLTINDLGDTVSLTASSLFGVLLPRNAVLPIPNPAALTSTHQWVRLPSTSLSISEARH
jgi:hypothetical protein